MRDYTFGILIIKRLKVTFKGLVFKYIMRNETEAKQCGKRTTLNMAQTYSFAKSMQGFANT